MELKINEGIRPSQLELGRYATGELSAEEAAAVEARLDERAHAWLAAVDAGAAEVPDFDAQALRARAAQVSVAPAEPLPAPANRRWMRAVAVIAAIFLSYAASSGSSAQAAATSAR